MVAKVESRSIYAKRAQRRKTTMFFIYMLPALVTFVLYKFWPIIYSLILSFFKWNFVGTMKWTGLNNFVEMLGREAFQKATINTFLYMIGLFPFFMVLPLVFALMLSNIRSSRFQNFYKALLFLPSILAFSIICLVWMWMFNPQFGVLNNILNMVGHPGFAWLSDKKTAMFSIILVSGWKHIGTNMILFIAGLLCINKEYIEAATIEGASGWQVFRKIKWPLLWPTTIYILITSVIFAAERAFTPINILTSGGPSDATTNLSHIIYVFAFEYFNIGLASSTAIFTSIFFLIITASLIKLAGGLWHYDD